MNIKKKFGNVVRELRRQKWFSQEWFAIKCGLHRTHIWLIENGKTNVTLENIEKLAETLGVSLGDLFKGFK